MVVFSACNSSKVGFVCVLLGDDCCRRFWITYGDTSGKPNGQNDEWLTLDQHIQTSSCTVKLPNDARRFRW